jgi:ABC-type dipeptide/oligopeptide/nickel transport system permease subunit
VSTVELTTVDKPAPPGAVPPSRRRALRRLLRNPLALAGAVVVLVAVGAALLAGLVAPHGYADTDFGSALQPPSGAHWFGTDELGRDQFSRVLYGLRASILVGAMSVALSLVVGVPLGLLAGFYPAVDAPVSRLTDTMLAFPFLVLAVGLAAIIGQAVLSFLGLGVRPPTPSLGVMLASAQPLFRDGPWMAVFPGVAIVLLTLALNLLGDGVRDALDPQESRR